MTLYAPTAHRLASYDCPDDGDDVTAASVNIGLQHLGDAVKAVTPPTTLSLSADRVRLVVSSTTSSPALTALGTLAFPQATELENSDSQLGVIVTKTVSPMTDTMLLYLPLDELLHYNGWTIASCVLKVKGKAGHAALPVGMPQIALVRFGASANTSLHASTWIADSAANVAAYEVEHDITLTPNQNAVIDSSQYQYALLVQNEYNTNALNGLQFRRIVLTLTGP
jgi:hypothetical protein